MQYRRHPNAPAAESAHTYRKSERVRKRSEFVRIQRKYRGKRSPHFVLILAPGPGPETRLGVTVTRKVGGAVARNRIKRRTREFFRLHKHELQPAHDLLIIARAGADKLSFADVESELAQALGLRLGVGDDG